MRCSKNAARAAAALAALIPLCAAAQDKSRALTEAYNASGQQLFRQLSAAPGNIVFSPYSIGTALAMALAGARGETERQMADVLRFRIGTKDVADANAKVLAILNGYDKSATQPACPEGMRIAGRRCETERAVDGRCPSDAVWDGKLCVAMPNLAPDLKLVVADALMLTGQGAALSKDYVALLKDSYAAEVFQNASLKDVNGWVERKTEGKIDKILDQPDQRSAVALLNAVYFKAAWAMPFNKGTTRDEAFHVSASQRVRVPMMHREADIPPSYPLVVRPGYRAIRLPYVVGSIGMVVVLPDAIDGLMAVNATLGAQELAELLAALRAEAPQSVNLALPRFKAASKAELTPAFREAGMVLAFDPSRADFSGMTGRPAEQARLAIGQIAHRAVIEVQEEGTEAAAASGAMTLTSAPVNPETFRVDRPFLYYVVDDHTGAILFQGRVVDPR
jgi:leukocyte elastase inhibitor